MAKTGETHQKSLKKLGKSCQTIKVGVTQSQYLDRNIYVGSWLFCQKFSDRPGIPGVSYLDAEVRIQWDMAWGLRFAL